MSQSLFMELSSRFLNLVDTQLSSFQSEKRLQHLVVYAAKASAGEAPTLEAIGEWPSTAQALPPVEADPELRTPSPCRRWYPLQEGEILLGVLRAECLPTLKVWPDSLDRRLQATALVLTHSMSLELERAKLLEELASQQEQISLMVHQLRNPLSALRTYAELLLRRLGPENRNRNLVEGMLNEQAQLDRYISGLDLIGSTRKQIQPGGQSALMLPPLLPNGSEETLRKVLRPLISRALVTANLQSRKWIGPSSWPEWTKKLCSSENGLIAEILANLIENGFKYSSSGSSLGLTFFDDGLCVWDEGDEIVQEDREKIFDKGYRGKSSANELGTGLGLALGRELAKQIGASLELVIPPRALDSLLPARGNAFLIKFSAEKRRKLAET